MYYKGIGPNRGLQVSEDDAIEYAADKCGIMIEYGRENEDAIEFRQMLIDWFFSGEWIKVDEEE